MATKAQLKQYFETGKIPTQAQFGELIDFVQPLISDNVSDRPNQTLLFGGDTPNPIINGLRIVHYYENDDTIYNYWIFTNEAGGNNQSGISIPMFVIKRISSKEPNLSLNMPNLEYAIPTKEQLTNWVKQGYDCDTATDSEIHHAMQAWSFKPWGGSSESNVKYYSEHNGSDFYNYICELNPIVNEGGETYNIPTRISKFHGALNFQTCEVYIIQQGSSPRDINDAWQTLITGGGTSGVDAYEELIGNFYKKLGGELI